MTAQPGRQRGWFITPRQEQVIRLIAAGRSLKQVGFDLGISHKMAECHCAEIRRRLNVASSREIPLAFMRQAGIDPYPRLESDAA